MDQSKEQSVLLAIDFETANGSRSSACSVGVVIFDEQTIRHEWYSLLNPQQQFSSFNIGIHGITPADVRNAPTTRQFAITMRDMWSDAIVVSHTHFDKGVMNAISEEAGIASSYSCWLDSCRIARRTWSTLPNHKLKTVSQHLGFSFAHHNALEDARACAHIVQQAMRQTDVSAEELVSAFT